MMSTIRPVFVESIPDTLEPGVLYISERFRVTQHLCACGCGSVVNASLSPARWSLQVADGAVTMTPSFGNFSFDCKSHYWIRNNRIIPAATYTEEEIQEAREMDAAASRAQFEKPPARASGWKAWMKRIWRRRN